MPKHPSNTPAQNNALGLVNTARDARDLLIDIRREALKATDVTMHAQTGEVSPYA